MRTIILSKSLGVFLGNHLNRHLWSKEDGCRFGITRAVTLPSERAAVNYLHTWPEFLELPDDMSFPYADVDHERMASEAACVAAGAESWSDPYFKNR